MIDVGQGDSTLIVTQNNKTILIDTGGKQLYEMDEWEKRNNKFNLMTSNIIPFFKSIGINKIDYLFLTHGDADHLGYASDLIDNFKVEKVIINNGDVNNYEEYLNYEKIGKYYKIDNAQFFSLNNVIYNDENSNSIVLYIKISDYKFLFMGDASVKQEKDIMNKYNLNNLFVLKVGHHGSYTSSSEEFINKLNPKYSVIQVGENNKFGHPSKATLNNLNNTIVYRTDIKGTILFKLNNNEFKISNYGP